jgi:hypothetical protein
MMVDTKLVGSDWGLRIMARNINDTKGYSIIVARSDKKDTAAQKVEGFVGYLAKEPLRRSFQDGSSYPKPEHLYQECTMNLNPSEYVSISHFEIIIDRNDMDRSLIFSLESAWSFWLSNFCLSPSSSDDAYSAYQCR